MTQKELLDQAIGLSNQTNLDVKLARKLIKTGNTLHKLFEMACNGETHEKPNGISWQDWDKDRNERQIPWIEERIEATKDEIRLMLGKFGLKLNHFNPDPRGFPVYLNLSNGASNSWGGQENGYGIG